MTIATQSLLFKRENDELPTYTSSSRFGHTIADQITIWKIPEKTGAVGV